MISVWCRLCLPNISTGIQNHSAYGKILKIASILGFQVPHVMAEPVGSFVWNYFREWRDRNKCVFEATHPECLRIFEVLDLGHGKFNVAVS